jgi:hypothetical protein
MYMYWITITYDLDLKHTALITYDLDLKQFRQQTEILDLHNNWNISTVFNGFWYQFTTEPHRSVFQLFCKSQ